MRLGELFAGYGGLGMAVEEVFGATTAWFSEWEPAPSKILAHHWPSVPNYGDVTKIDWANIEPVDIISGGSPCQDLSLAGKRRGMTGGTRSNLWESMREGIAIIKPKYVVWENVRGALSAGAVSELEQSEGRLGADGNPNLRAIGRVLGDLADLGYDAEWRGLRAADVGAPHGRFRVFILAAHADGKSDRQDGGAAPSNEARNGSVRGYGPGSSGESATNSSGSGLERHKESHSEPVTARDGTAWGHPERRHLDSERVEAGGYGAAVGETNWDDYAPAIHYWEAAMGRRAPAPTELTGRNGSPRLSPHFTEWMMGLPAGWITDPTIGISRNDQIKACGNGVVPQQAKAALTDMLQAFQAKDIAA